MYQLTAPFTPTGDQPAAIQKMVQGIQKGGKQTLLGATGTGKTFSISNAIAQTGKPTLVISHNKTLAAQLYNEFREFFPKNNVGYFVSYFDYYQPESYLPAQDLYIEKDVKRNEKIEELRLQATAALLSERHTVIVASVSCIYGLGSPDDFAALSLKLATGQKQNRQSLFRTLSAMQYERTTEPKKGGFRAKGDTIDVFPGFGEEAFRIRLLGDTVEKITRIVGTTGEKIADQKSVLLFPAKHFVTPPDKTQKALKTIRAELDARLPELGDLEAHRLKQRTEYDLEQIRELGYCSGIENYSRHFDGRLPGSAPSCLLDFFPKDFLMVIDESHVSLPQLHAMYKGDYARKRNLVDYGFRLPSALDNRPLTFEEFTKYMNNVIFVSATPGDWELRQGPVVEQLIRPTGIVDPEVTVLPAQTQVQDLEKQIRATTEKGHRTLVTVLTKRFAEDLTEYLAEKKIRVRYLHAEVKTLERTERLRQLRLGEFDCLIGINLLREGLDLPEVGLVAVLDADKEGYLRSDTSLIQTIGRACRNADSRVILYADKITKSMERALSETSRRRDKQRTYNAAHGITPKTIIKKIMAQSPEYVDLDNLDERQLAETLVNIEADMNAAADKLDFEKAIKLRDRLRAMQQTIQARGKA